MKVRRWAAMRNKNTPLDSVIDSYLLHCHHLAERTREFYRKNLGQFVRWLRANEYEAVLGDIDPNVVNQYVSERRKVSAHTARAAGVSVKVFGSWLAHTGIRHEHGRSVLVDVRLPKVPQDVRRPLGPADVEAILRAAKEGRQAERDYALMALAFDSGTRLGELCELEVGDIDLRERFVRVRAETSKSRKTREVPFGQQTAVALDRYIRDFREESDALPEGTPRLFLGLGGLPMTRLGMGQIFRRVGRRAGLAHFSAHVARHTWATNFRKYGSGDLLDLKQQGGWRDDQMLQRYSHQLPLAERRRGPSPMDALLRERRGGVSRSYGESAALRVVKAEAAAG